jgi:RimJ/RimL family protein N-acetyltransferase
MIGDWVMSQTGGIWVNGRGSAIGLIEDDGTILAGVLFDSYNGASCCMHVAARPGARWLNRGYLWTCFAYPFLQLKVKKLIGLVGANNLKARAFDEHLGFTLEATLTDAHPSGDLLIYSMTKDQCRWLNIKVPSYGKTICTAAA